jgi:flagellar biosynthesis GTPase FlhF
MELITVVIMFFLVGGTVGACMQLVCDNVVVGLLVLVVALAWTAKFVSIPFQAARNSLGLEDAKDKEKAQKEQAQKQQALKRPASKERLRSEQTQGEETAKKKDINSDFLKEQAQREQRGKEELATQVYLQRYARRCPRPQCGVWVSRISGCAHMICKVSVGCFICIV